ncbi:hypothetical protein BDF14DRAFT_1877671 [Spinellus fusiger]|nr:hypothetical protein BDF14DRAFT_1877671 [Spinellus fusiger]
MARPLSRSTFKKKLKRYLPHHTFTDNVDIMIFLNYLIFMETLAHEAEQDAEEQSQTMVYERNIANVTKSVLQKFRG